MLLSDFAPQHLDLSEEDGIPFVRFKEDRLTDEINIDQIGHELFALTDQFHCRQVVIDLVNLKLLTSSMLGKMITLHRKLHRKEGLLILCNSGDYVTEVLQTSRLDDYFHVVADRDAALEKLSTHNE